MSLHLGATDGPSQKFKDEELERVIELFKEMMETEEYVCLEFLR